MSMCVMAHHMASRRALVMVTCDTPRCPYVTLCCDRLDHLLASHIIMVYSALLFYCN